MSEKNELNVKIKNKLKEKKKVKTRYKELRKIN